MINLTKLVDIKGNPVVTVDRQHLVVHIDGCLLAQCSRADNAKTLARRLSAYHCGIVYAYSLESSVQQSKLPDKLDNKPVGFTWKLKATYNRGSRSMEAHA